MSWGLFVINPQSRLSPCLNFSAYILALPFPAAVLVIFWVKHKSQPSRYIHNDKGGRSLTTLLVLLIHFVCI